MTTRRAALLALATALAAAGCRPEAGCDLPEIECNGQCVDGSSVSNCAGCGVTCGAGQGCCAGCVDLQTSTLHCGACGTRCPNGATCAGGVCACPAGQAVCGPFPGTCVDVQHDVANCGACGNTCAIPGVPAGGATCDSGGCTCHPPSGVDCGGSPPCTSLAIDPANCGTCGHACAAEKPRSTCGGGACGCGAAADPDDCGTTLGCVNVATDPSNCGTCGLRCSGSTPTCSGGLCCGLGQTSCSGLCVNLATDVGNCGACGNACTAPQVCQASACVCPLATPTRCGASCCEGTACCASGTACQTKHSNGLGGFWFDCNPLYTSPSTTTLAAATAAANSWASGTDFPGLCDGSCLGRQTPTSCSVWCFGGSAFSGHVTTGATINCPGLCNAFLTGSTPIWQ